MSIHTSSTLRRLFLLTTILVAATSVARADGVKQSVSHSFADPDIYSTLPPMLYFTDEQTPTPVKDVQLRGKEIPLSADVSLQFDYQRNWKNLANDSIPRTIGAVATDTRCLTVLGSGIPSHRVRLVFTSPSGAKIRKISIDGRTSTNARSYASYNLSERNSLIDLPEGGSTDNVAYATNSVTNTFVWEGSATTVTFENTESRGFWYIRSFTVEYEVDPNKSLAPAITGDSTPFLFSHQVSITSTEANAAIYYTLDGSTPTTSSTRYTAPFSISHTTTVKAIAQANGKTPSAVAQATFTKLPLRSGLADLNASASVSATEYINLQDAVVTWTTVFPPVRSTEAPTEATFVQDNSTLLGAGIELINPSSSITLQPGDHVTGILVGVYSPQRHELSGWYFLNDQATVTQGSAAPAAEVVLSDVASPTQENTTGSYFDTDYLNQRVQFSTTVERVDSALRGFDGHLLVNPLSFNTDTREGDTGVQILLPDNDLQFEIGQTYTFSGVLFQYKYVLTTITLFRTLYVERNEDITDAQGRRLGRVDLEQPNLRLLTGDQVAIGISSKSHEAPITYSSSNNSVVRVDASGQVTAVAKGTATITVTLAATDAFTSVTKKIAVSVFDPTYQVANSDFTQWEDVEYAGYTLDGSGTVTYRGYEPDYWNGYVGASIGQSQLEPSDVEGRVYNPVLSARVQSSIHYPGILVSGSYEMPYSDDLLHQAPENAYAYDTDETAAEFTGLPDAVAVDVRGQLSQGHGRFAVLLHTPGTITYPSTDLMQSTATVIASAIDEEVNPSSATDFTTLTLPLSYAVKDVRPAYALVSFATDSDPKAVAASAYKDDQLVVRSLRFIYNSSLASATYGGQPITFDADGKATVDDGYSASFLKLTTDGVGATVTTGYNVYTRTLTITVLGDDISVNAANKHTYTIVFANTQVGVESPNATAADAPHAVYNLAGQRLLQPRRGINIIGGHKVVLR